MKKKLNTQNASPARVMPSARPPAALPPSTTMRNASDTCALSRRTRNVTRTAGTTARIPSHMTHRATVRPRSAGGASGATPYGLRVGSLGGAVTSPLGLEPVAHTRLRHDQLRHVRVTLDLPPEVRHVHPQILLRVTVGVAPHLAEQLLMRQRLAGVPDHGDEQPPLGRR